MSLLITPILETPLLKVPLIFATIALTHVGTNPPNPPAELKERQKYGHDSIVNAHFDWMTAFPTARAFGHFCQLCDTAVILATQFPSPLISELLPALVRHQDQADRIRVTPLFLTGWALSCAGSLLRLWCYRTLGRFFTYELSVRDNHRLITTGPYAIVRHPGYLGTTMISAGSLVMFFAPGSWWAECGIMESIVGKALAVGYTSIWVGITLLLWTRIDQEDAIMRSEFGSSWQAWARRTPYKLIPFIY